MSPVPRIDGEVHRGSLGIFHATTLCAPLRTLPDRADSHVSLRTTCIIVPSHGNKPTSRNPAARSDIVQSTTTAQPHKRAAPCIGGDCASKNESLRRIHSAKVPLRPLRTHVRVSCRQSVHPVTMAGKGSAALWAQVPCQRRSIYSSEASPERLQTRAQQDWISPLFTGPLLTGRRAAPRASSRRRRGPCPGSLRRCSKARFLPTRWQTSAPDGTRCTPGPRAIRRTPSRAP